MPCGCSNKGGTEYVYVSATGKTMVYAKEIEAKVAQIRDGGGGSISPRAK